MGFSNKPIRRWIAFRMAFINWGSSPQLGQPQLHIIPMRQNRLAATPAACNNTVRHCNHNENTNNNGRAITIAQQLQPNDSLTKTIVADRYLLRIENHIRTITVCGWGKSVGRHRAANVCTAEMRERTATANLYYVKIVGKITSEARLRGARHHRPTICGVHARDYAHLAVFDT